jgi:hypothetical protein
MESTQLNAIGVAIIVTVTEDDVVVVVSSAAVKQLLFRKPNGARVTVDATFSVDGVDGKIQYTTEADFLNIAGVWSVQAYVLLGSGFNGRSDVSYFEVRKNL